MLSKILCNLKKNISAFLPHKLCAVLPLRFNWASNKNYSVSRIFHFLYYTIERYYSQDNVGFKDYLIIDMLECDYASHYCRKYNFTGRKSACLNYLS